MSWYIIRCQSRSSWFKFHELERGCTCMYICMNIYKCIYNVHTHSWMNIFGTNTLMLMNEKTIIVCMDIVQTRLYSFTTTLHFPSGPIRVSLATLVTRSLSSDAGEAQKSLIITVSVSDWAWPALKETSSTECQTRMAHSNNDDWNYVRKRNTWHSTSYWSGLTGSDAGFALLSSLSKV